jgi:hypothetical protein
MLGVVFGHGLFFLSGRLVGAEERNLIPAFSELLLRHVGTSQRETRPPVGPSQSGHFECFTGVMATL